MPKILIVEDDKLFSKILKDEFEEKNCEVIQAFDGNDGLLAMKKERPDVVLLDIMMPTKDGISVLQDKQADESIADIPVLIITVSSNQAELDKTFELGAKDAMIKSSYTSEGIANRSLDFIS